MRQTIPALDPATSTGKARELFNAIQEKLGRVPNIMKTMGNAPAALAGYLALDAALAEGELTPAMREQLALAIGQANCCDYCISAHTAIGKMVGLDENDVSAARQSKADDAKTEVALAFAHKLVVSRGQATAGDIANVRAAGYTDGEIVEIIANVALNTFTNYFNLIAGTDIDFPRTKPARELAAV